MLGWSMKLWLPRLAGVIGSPAPVPVWGTKKSHFAALRCAEYLLYAYTPEASLGMTMLLVSLPP